MDGSNVCAERTLQSLLVLLAVWPMAGAGRFKLNRGTRRAEAFYRDIPQPFRNSQGWLSHRSSVPHLIRRGDAGGHTPRTERVFEAVQFWDSASWFERSTLDFRGLEAYSPVRFRCRPPGS
jgi:hypothetical protein